MNHFKQTSSPSPVEISCFRHHLKRIVTKAKSALYAPPHNKSSPNKLNQPLLYRLKPSPPRRSITPEAPANTTHASEPPKLSSQPIPILPNCELPALRNHCQAELFEHRSSLLTPCNHARTFGSESSRDPLLDLHTFAGRQLLRRL